MASYAITNQKASYAVTNQKASYAITNQKASYAVTNQKASYAITNQKASYAVTNQKASYAITNQKASYAVTNQKTSYAITNQKATYAVTNQKASYAVTNGNETCGSATDLARSVFFSLQITSVAVFFLSVVAVSTVTSGGVPVLTTSPICAHLAARRRADTASSVLTSALPFCHRTCESAHTHRGCINV